MTSSTTIVSPLRKGGHGIQGTYANCDHHARQIRPLIEVLEHAVPVMGFKHWEQGHNVHVLHTHDGRKYDLVPLVINDQYSGIRLRVRQSRSEKIDLVDAYDGNSLLSMIQVMTNLARPLTKGRVGGGIAK